MKFDDQFDTARPYIACFAILRKGNNIAMVLRKNTGWMDGHYGLPAGKVEWNETYSEGATREAKEEAGVEVNIKDLKFAHIAHRHSASGTVFIDWTDVYFEAPKWAGEPYNAEPEKSERLDWLDITNLPKNIVPSQRAALEHIAKNISYSEFGWETLS